MGAGTAECEPHTCTPKALGDAASADRARLLALYTFVYDQVGNREAAESLTRALALEALARRPAEDECGRAARLYHAACSAVATYWRPGVASPVVPEERGASASSPDQPARAIALLDRLPEPDRSVLSYRIVERLSVAETARRMGASEADVKIAQHRALTRAARLRQDV